MKRTPLRARSKKTEREYVARRSLVRDLLAEKPWCELRWDNDCTGRSEDVDERLSRAQGGSILDPSNLAVACRHCHSQKHLNPTEAERRGFTVQRRHLGPEEAA